MASNGKRRRSTNDNDNGKPPRRRKVLDTREKSLPPNVNTSSPLTDEQSSAAHPATFSASVANPSNRTLNVLGSVSPLKSLPNVEYQEPGMAPGYCNDNQFREGRDFDLEVVVDHNDPRLRGPSYYLLQDVGSYQPGDSLSQILVAHGQLFVDDHGNLVRIKLRQSSASTIGNTNNERIDNSQREASSEYQSRASQAIANVAATGALLIQDSLPNDNAVSEDSNVYHGHIGYIPCPNDTDGLTEGEFNARLEEWTFQVPRDLPATVAGWIVDASRVLTRSGVLESDNNAQEETPLQSQQPSKESYSQIQVPPIVDRLQARSNVPAYTSDNTWTTFNPEVFGNLLQETAPRVMSQPILMVPANNAVHLTNVGVPQQPPAPQQRARQSRAPQQIGSVSQQRQRINPYASGGLFAQEFNRPSELSAVHKTPADRSAAILAERATDPPEVMPDPSKRQIGQKQARQTRDSRAAIPASDAQPSRRRMAPAPNLGAQMPLTALDHNMNLHNTMGQPTQSQPTRRSNRNIRQQAPTSFNVPVNARSQQRNFIPHEALSRSNIAEAMREWDQGEEQYQQRQQTFFPPENDFRLNTNPPNPRTRRTHARSYVTEEPTFEETPSSGPGVNYETSGIDMRPSAQLNVASTLQPPDGTDLDTGGLEAILEFLNNE